MLQGTQYKAKKSNLGKKIIVQKRKENAEDKMFLFTISNVREKELCSELGTAEQASTVAEFTKTSILAEISS